MKDKLRHWVMSLTGRYWLLGFTSGAPVTLGGAFARKDLGLPLTVMAVGPGEVKREGVIRFYGSQF